MEVQMGHRTRVGEVRPGVVRHAPQADDVSVLRAGSQAANDTSEVDRSAAALLSGLTAAFLSLVQDGVLADRTVRQMATLLFIEAAGEPRTVKEVAEHLSIPRPSASRSSSALVEAGLIRRWENPTDRRIVFLEPTRAGRRILRNLLEALATPPAAQTASVSAREISSFRAAGRPSFPPT
jgi:DNA-binding MarR family transcriptional regulator